jgi:hypothetical protein
VAVVGYMYGFRVSLSGDGQEKFRGPPGSAGETGEGSNPYILLKWGCTISISRFLAECKTASRSRLPIKIKAIPTMQTETRYAPKMPPICAGSSDLSLDAPAESGGPSSGDGAGSQSIPSGLFLGASVRILAELIAMEKRSKMTGALIASLIPTSMMPARSEYRMGEHA